MSNILSAMPSRLVAGDSLTLALVQAAQEYPAGAGWAAKLTLVPIAGGMPLEITGSGGSVDWSFSVSSAQTAALAAGLFRWSTSAVNAGERTTLDSGQIQVLPDPAGSDVDARSHARKVLDALNATIEGRATTTQLEVEFEDGRRIKHMENSEILKLRREYVRKVAAEDQRRTGPKKVLARL
ncbi:hypothetical protein [Sphingorhabdus sp. 109]|uniref:hypothetical protein n=1 Tax=Sphingorhabdus sp. 109 TaxID=2653173 RepID=UPI0012EFEEA3|nr:hypothetical protein [Sphingorhabdus sp. 109]VWX56711.1 conserved hypothetical protein [Sphingorhabdus sp. 109]